MPERSGDDIEHRIRDARIPRAASLCIFLEERDLLKRARVPSVRLPWGIFYRHMERRRREGEKGRTGRPFEGAQAGRKEMRGRRQSPRSSNEKIGSRHRVSGGGGGDGGSGDGCGNSLSLFLFSQNDRADVGSHRRLYSNIFAALFYLTRVRLSCD